MSLKVFFRSHHLNRTPLLLLVLVLLGFGAIAFTPQVHATGITFVQMVITGCDSLVTTCSNGYDPAKLAKGDALVVIVFTSSGGSTTVSDSQSNTWNQLVGFGSNEAMFIFGTFASANGVDTVTVTRSPADIIYFSQLEYSGVSIYGSTSSKQLAAQPASGTFDPGTAGINPGSWIVEGGWVAMGANVGSLTPASGQTQRNNVQCFAGFGGGGPCGSFDLPAPGASFPMSLSWSGGAGGNANVATAATAELESATGASFSSATQCFGNCGSPAVTLVNTNSTHGFQFNQSLTFFYRFQSSLNGFLLNVTTSLAKAYTNGQTIYLGVYTITFCPAGQTAFSQTCPGLLQQSNSLVNPAKGKFSLANLAVPVFNGEWIGIAVSALYQPFDLNDTNSNVALLQTNGVLPPSISTSNILTSCSCKMGLWAFINGNVVTSVPPPTFNGQCPGLLDCVLPNLVFSFCSSTNPGCIAVSALVWSVILASVSALFVGKYGSELAPSIKLPFGEIFLFFGVVWIAVMGGLSLTFAWVTLLVFLVVSIIFGKQVGAYL